MDRDEAGSVIDAQFEEWKHDLEAMRLATDRRLGGVGGALWQEVEHLRREFMGLRIKKAATWLAPEDAWEATSSAFHATWADWIERALCREGTRSERSAVFHTDVRPAVASHASTLPARGPARDGAHASQEASRVPDRGDRRAGPRTRGGRSGVRRHLVDGQAARPWRALHRR